jgi:hypothetical protein
MPQTIYLDTNQFVRVFERESETLFPLFAEAVKRNDWKLIVSEANVLEVYHGIVKGADINKIQKGFDLVETLKPLWLRISGLEMDELQTAFIQYQGRDQYAGISAFLTWPEFLAAMLKTRDISVLIDLAMSGISGTLSSLYRNGLLVREDQYWQLELDAASERFRQMIQNQRRELVFKNNFIETVINTCNFLSTESEQLRKFAEELWQTPGVCPGFRLSFEVTVSLLRDNQSAWTTSRFYDQRHMLAILYVDMFVGLDRGQRPAIADFERRVGNSIGIDLSSRCYRRIEEVMDAKASYA